LLKAATPKPIVLNIGITGHRAGALTAPVIRSLDPIVDKVFRKLRKATLKVQKSEDAFCSVTPAALRLHTGLASGADQIAARWARSRGYSVTAVLPFAPDEYRKDFELDGEAADFDRALDAADEIIVLPGERSDPEGAYVLVGKQLIESADIMVAIWDGEEARGPGGTAHVVELALKNSVPVIHIHIRPASRRVRTRALTGRNVGKPKRSSLRWPGRYRRLVREALKPKD
jgi:hypothetical protein